MHDKGVESTTEEHHIQPLQAKLQKQRHAFERFIQAIADAEPICDEFGEAIRQGIHIKNEHRSDRQ